MTKHSNASRFALLTAGNPIDFRRGFFIDRLSWQSGIAFSAAASGHALPVGHDQTRNVWKACK